MDDHLDSRGFPRLNSRWTHKKNSIEYDVYDITNADAAPGRNAEYPVTVSYTGKNGKRWSKPLANFLEKMKPFFEETTAYPARSNVRLTNTLGTLIAMPQAEQPSNHIIPPFKINFITRSGQEPDNTGLWYFVDVQNFNAPVAEHMLRVMCSSFYKSFAGHAFCTNDLLQYDFQWGKSSAARRDHFYDLGVNYVGNVKGSPRVWGNRTAKGGLLSEAYVALVLMRTVAKYLNAQDDTNPTTQVYALAKDVAIVTFDGLVRDGRWNPANRDHWRIDAVRDGIELHFPLSAFSDDKFSTCKVRFIQVGHQILFDADSQILSYIEDLVGVSWVTQGNDS